jgi:hypothetical protein
MGGTFSTHEMKNAYSILVGKSEGKISSKGPRVDGRIILKWVLGKQSWAF